jgi:hypothetical protein
MRKAILLSLAALALTCLAQQPASAWCNIRFKAGVDLTWQAGGNDFLWGLYRSGPYCGDAGAYGPSYGGYGVPYGGYASADGGTGYGMPAAPYAAGNAVSPNNGKATVPTGTTAPVTQSSYPSSYYGSGYQPVGYYYPGYSYQAPSYAPSGYSYAVPSYWYGR